ncbi:hypothetical protein HPB47_017422 [Ixodes persulcatus]|uniref:Uncharacterized protein n=1 Tax=Ixodes persulcatus TaxID=34615 RepID=A0AC60QRW7_IXOPE|nr:hypothetical protein HPB47_017422 [Ixodes persulcatus]
MKVNAGPSTGPCYQRHDVSAVAAGFLIPRFTESKCLDRALFSALLLLPAESVESVSLSLSVTPPNRRLPFCCLDALSLLILDERVQIVVLAQEGLSRREISRRVGRPVKTVQRFIAAFRDDDGRLDDAPHRRHPRETTATEYRHILEAALGDPFRAARDIRDALELEISDTTSPLLTERHKQLRLGFAHSLQNWTVDYWTHVIFSDEAMFCTQLDQQRRVWRPDNFLYDPHFIQEVAASGRRASPNELWEAVQREWNDLRNNEDLVLHLYRSLPRRIQSLIHGEGNFLRY